jgi:hypothetical protein
VVIRGLRLLGNWDRAELRELTKILAPLPAQWVEHNPCLKAIARQPVLTNAPPDAPGHSKYEPRSYTIVVFDKGVYHGEEINPEQFRRSVYHELAHTLLRDNRELLGRWQAKTRHDDYVDDYARTGPEEDFADSFSEFLIHPDKAREAVPSKFRFLQKLLADARGEKIAMFLDGFSDEMTKIGAGMGALRSMLAKATGRVGKGATARTPGSMSVGKGLLMAGGAGGVGAVAGMGKGKKQGLEAGTQNMDEGMRQAYQLGIRRGAIAMRQAIVNQMRGAQKAG